LETAIDERHGVIALRRWAPRKPYNVEITLNVEQRKFWGEYSFVITSGQQGTYRRGRESCTVGTLNDGSDDAFEIKGNEWVKLPERFTQRGIALIDLLDPMLWFCRVSRLCPTVF
jgi:hypothetical protein